jgi:hypothetical protein
LTIEEFKKENDIKTSEDVFGIDSPVDYQCSNFNSIYKDLERINRSMNYAVRENEVDDVIYHVKDAMDDIGDIEKKIAHVHEKIEELREWGEQWKKLCKQALESEVTLEDYI